MGSRRHQWTQHLAQVTALIGVVAGLAWGGTTVAHASTLAIPDVSEWQGKLNANQVANLKNQVSFVINRRQYGAGYQDRFATNNTNLYVQYGIPFGEYDYATFTSAASAKHEAKVFYDRSNAQAQFYVLDFEVDDVTSGSTNAAVNAWVHEMRQLTSKHLIFYSYQSFATSYADSARQKFDAQWIANYSYRPTISFALWQYTDHHYLPALGEYTDNSLAVTTVQPIDFWTDSESLALTHNNQDQTTAPVEQPTTPTPKPTSTATVTKPAYSHYYQGQHVYIHASATSYLDGSAIPSSAQQRYYRVSKVKAIRKSHSRQALYLSKLHKWVLSQDVSGYWIKNHRAYRLNRKLFIYRDKELRRRKGGYYVAGNVVRGKVVRDPDGNGYRIKTRLGYISGNVAYSATIN